MSVAEIEAAISNLPPEDFARIRDCLLERGEMSHRPCVTMEEIERRGLEITSGTVTPVKGAAFLKRIREVRKEVS